MGASRHGRSPPGRSYDHNSYLSLDKSFYEDLNTVEHHMSEASIAERDDETVFKVNEK